MASRSRRVRGLIELLDRHVPADAEERRHVERTRSLVVAAGDPFDRRRYRPGHVTASAFVFHPVERALLLIRHATLERWLQPGGHVEADDVDLLDAARRELAEETGLETWESVGGPAPFDVDVHSIPKRDSQPRHEHFDVRFLLRAGGCALAPSSDARTAAWIPLDRVRSVVRGGSWRRVLAKLANRLPRL